MCKICGLFVGFFVWWEKVFLGNGWECVGGESGYMGESGIDRNPVQVL